MMELRTAIAALLLGLWAEQAQTRTRPMQRIDCATYHHVALLTREARW
jgi:hypothetical protein